jgi:hypothetical protein
MRLAVSTRLLASALAALALALATAACGASQEAATIDLGSGRAFVPAVVDSVDNVGLMPSIALNDDGSPFMSSFGFPEELEAGDIPVSRSVYAPSVPSVLVASVDDGIFTRGAVAMAQPPPNLVRRRASTGRAWRSTIRVGSMSPGSPIPACGTAREAAPIPSRWSRS